MAEKSPGTVLVKIIESEAKVALSALGRLDRVRALAILSNLVTLEGTRDVVSEENLISETRSMPVLRILRGDLKKLLAKLVTRTGLLRRSLSSGNTYYELTSEFLITWIQKKQQTFRGFAALITLGGLLVFTIGLAILAVVFNAQKIEEKEKAIQQLEESIDFAERDLSVLYEKIGDDQRALGDLNDAIESYRDSLAIREKLAKQDPGNAGWQRDLSVNYNKVGDVQRAQGDLNGALESYRDSLAIAEKLAKQDPGNAGWQTDLAFSYWRTGTTLLQTETKSKSKARRMVEKGRDILKQLKASTGLTVWQQEWLDGIEADLQDMQ